MRTTTLIPIVLVALLGFTACECEDKEHSAEHEMMENNKTLVAQAMEEIWNNGNLDAIDTYISDDFVNHSEKDEDMQGKEGLRMQATSFRTGFPDATITQDMVLAEGNYTIVHWTCSGTNTGPMMNGAVPATNKSATMSGIAIDEWADGKIVATWEQMDMMGMMEQLGMMPGAGHDMEGMDEMGDGEMMDAGDDTEAAATT